jgi:hypothetical protein
MQSVRETSVRSAVLGEVRNELEERKPADGYRAYDAVRVSSDVEAAFKKVAAGKSPDAVISINEVVDQYARDLKANVGAVNTRGPSLLTAKEAKALLEPQQRGRVAAFRAELSRGPSRISEAALLRSAARFIADHSAPLNQSGNAIDVLFPAFDVGNGGNWGAKEAGISAVLIKDAKSAQLMLKMFEGDASEGELARLRTFDPKKEALIVVQDSEDETSFYPAAINKKSGEARGFDSKHNEVNFTAVESREDFELIFGPGSGARVKDDDYATAYYDRLHKLFDRGKPIALNELDPPELDHLALTQDAAGKMRAFFASSIAFPANADFSADNLKTLKAIRAAVKAGEEITVGESHGDPILLMPRKFSGKPTEDYAVGWAVSALIESVPELRRFYNVNSTVKTPNPDSN